VLHEAGAELHVSGHACQEEIKLMLALTKPRYYMPIHGESRHLSANRDLARYMGMKEKNVFITDVGRVLEIDAEGARFAGEVPAGKVLVDGYGVGDVGNIVLRDRRHLSQDGLIVVVATIDAEARLLLSDLEIISRGFIYVREAEELMEEVRAVAFDSIMTILERRERVDRTKLKRRLQDDLTKFLYSRTRRKPMILPIIMNV
jgi:ribonuclease J